MVGGMQGGRQEAAIWPATAGRQGSYGASHTPPPPGCWWPEPGRWPVADRQRPQPPEQSSHPATHPLQPPTHHHPRPPTHLEEVGGRLRPGALLHVHLAAALADHAHDARVRDGRLDGQRFLQHHSAGRQDAVTNSYFHTQLLPHMPLHACCPFAGGRLQLSRGMIRPPAQPIAHAGPAPPAAFKAGTTRRPPPPTSTTIPRPHPTPTTCPTWYSSLRRLLFFCSVYIWISSA